jgi:outer membrane protein assembly factor BamB
MKKRRFFLVLLLVLLAVATVGLWLGTLALVQFQLTGSSILAPLIQLIPTLTPEKWRIELTSSNQDRLADLAAVGLPLSPAWEYQAAEPIARPPLYSAGHVVLLLISRFDLWSINADSGNEEWRYESARPIDDSYLDDILILDETLAFQGPGFLWPPLYVINLETGQKMWETPQHVVAFTSDGKSRLFVSDGSEYQALDAASGRVIWISEFRSDDVRSVSTRYDSSARELYVSSRSTRAVLDGETGQLRRELSEDLFGDHDLIIVDNGVVYGDGNYTHPLFAADSRANRVIWTKNYRIFGGIFKPMVHNNILFIRDYQKALLAVNRQTGDLSWRYPPVSDSPASVGLLSNLVVLDGIVYGIFSDARLRGFDAANGREIGYIQFVDVSHAPLDLTVPGLAVSRDMLYISLGKTRLYAFKTVH